VLRRAVATFEMAREMALIAEPDLESYLTQGQLPRNQKLLRRLDASVRDYWCGERLIEFLNARLK
jgi:hypothetical protein